MLFKKIIKMFEDGNVMVVGLRGRGKDMLMANVVARRNLPYVSNTNYTDDDNYHRFVPTEFDCGGNSYKNFIEDDILYYKYPYPDGTDIYLGDCGVYFPSQYCNQLNRDYSYLATFSALTRHLGKCNFHCNCQNLNRIYDKLREQSDVTIMCMRCFVVFGWVLQSVRIYERSESAVSRVPPYRVPRPMLNRDRIQRWELDRQNYEILYGRIRSGILIYKNLSNYDTRVFKSLLLNGRKPSDPKQGREVV